MKHFLKFEIISENQQPTCHIKNKMINFASVNRPVMAIVLASISLERFPGHIKYPLKR